MDSHGARLKQLRLERGLSLEEVQKKTRINLNILKAVEGDSISNLSPIYLKSFIKIYCAYLGVDYKDYVSHDLPEPVPAPQVAKVRGTLSGSDPAKNNSILNAKPIQMGGFNPGNKVKMAVILFIAFAVISLVLFSLGKLIASHRSAPALKSQKSVAKISQVKKEAKKSVSPQQPVKVQAAVVKPLEISLKPRKDLLSEIRLVIRTRENCFLHLKIDGKVVFHQELAKGRPEIWTGKNRMELSIGNAGAVELEVNGQIFSKLGRRGESIKGILITREGLTIPR
jgi:transcriptional regulator with XRE-family HTH domain